MTFIILYNERISVACINTKCVHYNSLSTRSYLRYIYWILFYTPNHVPDVLGDKSHSQIVLRITVAKM